MAGAPWMVLVVFATIAVVSQARLPDACSPFCNVDTTFEPSSVQMDKESDYPVYLNTNISASAAENFSISLDADDPAMAYAQEEVTTDPMTGFLKVRLTIFGGKQYGRTTFSMAMKWWSNGEVVVVVYKYDVTVVRPMSATSTQQVLEYVVMGISLAVCFLAGCETTMSHVKRWIPWIVCSLLFQCVLVPICCLALVELFTLGLVPKMGVMTVMYSPAALVAVCFAAVVEVEVGLAAILVILHLLLSNASISIWVLQFRRLDDKFSITTGDLPYNVMLILLAVATPLFICGMLVRRYQKQFADAMAKITTPISIFTILLALIGSIYSGVDLFANLEWRSGLCAVTWPLIIVLIIVVIMLATHNTSPSLRAVSLFLLVKSFYIPSVILESAFSPPQLEASLVPAYFLSLTTIIGASVVSLSYVFYACLIRRVMDEDDNAKLVLQIDPEDEQNAAEQESQYRLEYERKVAKSRDDEGMAGALMNAGSFGVPSVVWF